MCNIENKTVAMVNGNEIVPGDVMEVWWFGKLDKVRQIGEYRGPMLSCKGSLIATFDNNRCGMQIEPEKTYKVYRDVQAAPVPSDQIPETD